MGMGRPADLWQCLQRFSRSLFLREGTGGTRIPDNVDEYYERIKGRGAKIICPPQNMEWNVREMLVEDPDGHRIRFGHSIDSANI